MRINLESTAEMGLCNDVPVRVWTGKSEGGVPLVAFIARMAVPEGHDASEFERDLREAPTNEEVLTETDLRERVLAACEHELACRRCGASIGEIGLARAEAEPGLDEALERLDTELAEQLVTSVRVERRGAHEQLTVWVRGKSVGTLTLGEGEARLLRHLLLSEDVVRKAKAVALEWRSTDGLGASRVDDLVCAFEAAERLVRLTELEEQS